MTCYIIVQGVTVNAALKHGTDKSLVKDGPIVNKVRGRDHYRGWIQILKNLQIYTKKWCEALVPFRAEPTFTPLHTGKTKEMMWGQDNKRGKRKTEVVESMCRKLLLITPHEEDASKWSSAPYNLLFSVKSTQALSSPETSLPPNARCPLFSSCSRDIHRLISSTWEWTTY